MSSPERSRPMTFDAQFAHHSLLAPYAYDMAALPASRRNTDELSMSVPVASVAVRLTPADFVDLPYSPVLLLPVHFDAALTSDPEYVTACEVGFDAYFEEMLVPGDSLEQASYVSYFYTCSEVLCLIADDLLGEEESIFSPSSSAWCAGFRLGWLSALALTQRDLALFVLAALVVLVDRLHSALLCDR